MKYFAWKLRLAEFSMNERGKHFRFYLDVARSRFLKLFNRPKIPDIFQFSMFKVDQ